MSSFSYNVMDRLGAIASTLEAPMRKAQPEVLRAPETSK